MSWLMERTKGRRTQFDVILQSSKQRMNIKARLLEIQSKVAPRSLLFALPKTQRYKTLTMVPLNTSAMRRSTRIVMAKVGWYLNANISDLGLQAWNADARPHRKTGQVQATKSMLYLMNWSS
jgi:hypothetical protein